MLDVRELFPDDEVIAERGVVRSGTHSIAYRVIVGAEPSIEIAFAVHNGAQKVTRRQTIALAPSWEPFANCGPWFACPGCARRVMKLYMPWPQSSFVCRRCSGLTYTSSQIHDDRVGKLRRDPARVTAILSGKEIATETLYMLAMKAGLQRAEAGYSPSR